MNPRNFIQTALQVLVVLMITAGLARGAFAYTEEEEQEAAAGADASNPTAAVNFQDIRYRYFDLAGGDEVFETNAFDWGMGLGVRFMY